jgi:hypothetical protein
MMVVFILVGLVFLLLPDETLTFFNKLTRYTRFEEAPLNGPNFFLVLASGYMYLVSLIAYLMFKHPRNGFFPLLLANGKFASSALSLGMFILHGKQLITFTNFIVDGLIGAAALYFYFTLKRI